MLSVAGISVAGTLAKRWPILSSCSLAWYDPRVSAFFGEHWRFNGAEKKVSERYDDYSGQETSALLLATTSFQLCKKIQLTPTCSLLDRASPFKEFRGTGTAKVTRVATYPT